MMLNVRNRLKIGVIATVAITILGVIIGLSPTVLADGNVQSNILRKAAYYQLYNCYQNNLDTNISLSEYSGTGSLFTSDTTYPLPYGFTGTDKVSCKQLIDGASGFDGLAKYAKEYGQNTPETIPPADNKDVNAVTQFMVRMGYIASAGGTSDVCAKFSWDATYDGTGAPRSKTVWVKMCAPKLKDGYIDSDNLTVEYSDNEVSRWIVRLDTAYREIRPFCKANSLLIQGGCHNHAFNSDTKWEDFVSEVRTDIADHTGTVKTLIQPGVTAAYKYQPVGTPDNTMVYTIDSSNWNSAASGAIKYLSNNNFPNLWSLQLSTEEKAVLTQKLLENYFGLTLGSYDENGGLVCGQKPEFSGYTQIGYYVNGSLNKNCWAKPKQNANGKVYFYNSKGFFDGKTTMKFAELAEVTNDFSLNTLSDASATTDSPGDAGNGEDDGRESPCTLAGGPLSWILCPVLSVVGKTVQFLYGWIEDQFLDVDANFYNTSSETYSAWQDFQGYANIFFIILLVLVIVSQVTGFGISNYGIKKTLPKLIIAIILINISFFVCQIAVDLSNIVGSTVENLLGDRAFGSGGFADTVGAIVSYAAGAGEAIAIGVGAYKLAALSPELFASWMPMIILALIGCVLGILFFFIILCVRQAAIIVLIILSPLAIAAYALPNTKKLFDRWFKLFTALLLVYPICGLLMGGGRFVSGLLIESAANGDGGLGMILVGLLANIVPFFLVPTILKSSMAAMGNLGAKISGFGDRINRTLGRGVVGSEFVKDRQQRKVNDLNRARVERYNKIKARGGSLSRGQQRKYAKSTAAMQKYNDEQQDLENLANSGDVLETLESRKATRQREYEEKQINDYASMVKNGGVRYTDSNGSEQTVNANDVGSLREAQLYYASQAEQAADEQTRKRNAQIAQSLQLLQFGKGDTGRTEAVKNLADLVFGDKNGNLAYGKDSQIVQNLAQQIAANDKWMASLKAEDPGTFKLVNAITGKEPLKEREAYEKLDASKVSAASIPNLSDHVFNQFDKYQIKNDKGDIVGYNIEKIKKDLGAGNAIALSNHITRAMTDPRIANQIKDKKDIDNIGKLNAIREAAYQAEQENYIKQQAATGKTETELKTEFEKQYGKFRKLNVGDDPDTLKVRHARKATKPTGWRPDPNNNNRWTQFNPDGTVDRVLTPEEVIRAEEIERYNAQVDINNELNDENNNGNNSSA